MRVGAPGQQPRSWTPGLRAAPRGNRLPLKALLVVPPAGGNKTPTRWSESFVEEELGLYEIQLLH